MLTLRLWGSIRLSQSDYLPQRFGLVHVAQGLDVAVKIFKTERKQSGQKEDENIKWTLREVGDSSCHQSLTSMPDLLPGLTVDTACLDRDYGYEQLCVYVCVCVCVARKCRRGSLLTVHFSCGAD